MKSSSSTTMTPPTGVHFVGSVPLATTEEVFRKLCSTLPDQLETIPDGETASRYNFIRWQNSIWPASILSPYLPSYSPSDSPPSIGDIPRLLKDLRTSYDDVAISSYQTLRTLRDQGIIPPHVKFQVSLPTPANDLMVIDKRYRAGVQPFYEAAIFRAVRRIQDSIPHEDLAIQWDCALEYAWLERAFITPGLERFAPWFEPIEEGVIERLIRCVKGHVDEDVDMGFHLCYGDFGHQHFVQPKDVGVRVWVLMQVKLNIGRWIDWVHMPVPKGGDDVEHLQGLEEVMDLFRGGSRPCLGLVHAGPEDGTRKRIVAAQDVLRDVEWSVATECGMGRTPRDELDSILEISRKVVSSKSQVKNRLKS